MIDWSTKFGRKAKRHLRQEHTIWLTTVGPDLTPQPRPVWYTWDGKTFLIYSRPNTHKVQHLTAHPQVALHFNTDAPTGDTDVIVFTGTAAVVTDVPPANKNSAYMRRYRARIAGLSDANTPAKYGAAYSVAIRVTPTHLRGW
jgi:PPOX class probable F420-dependent enzyme